MSVWINVAYALSMYAAFRADRVERALISRDPHAHARCPGVLVSMTVKPKDWAVAAARCLA